MVAAAWAAEPSKPVAEPAQPKAEATKPATVPVYVEEDIFYFFVDEPEHHFNLARENFLKKDFKATAHEIRKGATFLRLELARATGKTENNLRASIQELDKLAVDVEKGTVTSTKQLEQGFARAHHALAQHHYAKASDFWTKKEAKKVGQELKAAAYNIKQSLAWDGREVEAGTKVVLKDAKSLAGKLIEGLGWVPEEVGKGLDATGKEIDKLGKMLETPKK